jgi:hypothetical protein
MRVLMISLISVLLVTSLLVTSIGPVQQRQASWQSEISSEEYAIYAVVVGWMFSNVKGALGLQLNDKTLVIGDQTVSDSFAAVVGENEGKKVKRAFSTLASQETIDDYVAKNSKSHQLTKSLDLKLKYTIVPKENIEQIFKIRPGAWEEFFRQFHDSTGFIELSRAGFNSGGTQAIVYAQHLCGGLCGTGHHLLLVKKNKEWIVKKAVMAWVS